jgi:ribonuclease-3
MLDFENKLAINKYKSLEKDLGYAFKNESLLIQALTHSSKANEEKQLGHINTKDNQILEFRGDAVLSMIVTDILIEELPKCNEGTLTQAKSEIVREST